jgi:succinate dehydrogenase/fumarate reductase flavoprotein subunit
MAVGEAACVSVHGANRLGSNSLIDLVVFGRAAGLRCAETTIAGATQPELPKGATDRHLARLDKFRNAMGDLRSPSCASKCSAPCRTTAPCSAPATFSRKASKLIEEVYKKLPGIDVQDRTHGLEHRPRRSAGVRQPHRPGRCDGESARPTARKAAAPTPARITPTATTKTG